MTSFAFFASRRRKDMLSPGRFLLLHLCLLAYLLTEANGEPNTKATTQMATRTTWYTTCGVYRYNVSNAIRLVESQQWNPTVAFFYIEDGLLDNVVEGIRGFFEQYAACGMSLQVDIVLPRADTSLDLSCGRYPCKGKGLDIATSDLTVRRGEFVHLVARVFNKIDAIDESIAYEYRVVYLFTNVNFSQSNSRLYPDFCRYNLPTNTISALGKHLTIQIVWYTPVDDFYACYKGSPYAFDGVTISAFKSAADFKDALISKCIASIGTQSVASTTSVPSSPRRSTTVIIIVSSFAWVAFVGLLVGYCVFRHYRRRSPRARSENNSDLTEFSADEIELMHDQVLGSGSFATVCKGRMAHNGSDVAVKVLRLATAASTKSFGREITLLRQLRGSEHVVRIEGTVHCNGAIAIVLELCELGDLWNYLRNNLATCKTTVTSMKEPLQVALYSNLELSLYDLVRLCWQIADGMGFLSSHGYIHRDLAARNVLLKPGLTAKISDFGLCRYTDGELYVAYQEANLPTRWMALEALKCATFSTLSDVWSYGVLMYEIYSGGEMPYSNVCPSDLLAHLESGRRLPQPLLCPADIYELMLDCWCESPNRRPTFTEAKYFFSRCLKRMSEGYVYAC